MRVALVAILTVVLVPAIAALMPLAAATPPVCLVREVGSEGGKVHAEVWLTCGAHAEATVCPRDGFCTSTGPLPDARIALLPSDAYAPSCSHLVHGYGFDTFFCVDTKGKVGCMVYTETYYWEGGYSRNCIA